MTARADRGARLRAAREARGLSIGAVAIGMNISKATVVDLETGRGTLTVGRLIDYAEMLGMMPVDLAPELDPSALAGVRSDARTEALRALDVSHVVTLTWITGRNIANMIPELGRMASAK